MALPQVPFKLTPEDLGRPNILDALIKGQQFGQNTLLFPENLKQAQLMNEMRQVQAQYAQPMAEQDLQKAILYNKFYGPDIQSQIGLRGAEAGLAGANTKKIGVETSSEQMKLDYLRKLLSQQQQSQPKSMTPSPYNQLIANNESLPTQQQSYSEPSSILPNNSIYGVDVPQPSQQDIANKMLLGLDTFAPKQENAKKQIQDQYTQYQKALENSIQESVAANNMNQAINVFNKAMDESFYTGHRLGHLPSSGLLSPPGDLSPEQTADRAALQMLPSAIETLRDSMGSARFSNLDMNMAAKMKFDRTMDREARETQTAWVTGVNERMKEKAKFLSYLSNPDIGIKKSQADQLWASYQQDFPLISQDGKTFQGKNLGNWPLYTTPKAISSIKQTGSYSPTKSEKDVFMMQVPDGRGGYVIMPIKKGKVESAFRKGARPL